MKTNKFISDISSLSTAELLVRLEELRQQLFSLRLQAARQPVKDVKQFEKLRRNIARVLTRMRQVD